MRKQLLLAVTLAMLAVLLPSAGAVFAVDCPTAAAPAPLSFAPRTYIDRNRAGGEPVSVIAQDGSISVSSHAGTTHLYKNPESVAGGGQEFAYGYTNQTLNWRSDDNGQSWQFVGLAGLREGPHTATSTGFSDPDYGMDAGGRIYNVEIDLANVSVFSSTDDGQTYAFANPMAGSGDRPWVTGGDAEEAILYVNLPKTLLRTTDGGITWVPFTNAGPGNGKLLNDRQDPSLDTWIAPVSMDAIAITNDDAKTWATHAGAGLANGEQIDPPIAVDKSGNIYMVSDNGSYDGPSDSTPTGKMTFNYFNRQTMEWGETPIEIPTPTGDVLWPWIIAGDDGRVGVAWFQTLAGQPDVFYIYAAYTTNGHGTPVTCSDGSTSLAPPVFSVANASGAPIHRGDVCLSGTTCNATTSFPAGDRRLGDFLTVNFDKAGRFFIVSGDTTLPTPTGVQKPISNPVFIGTATGEPLLTTPMSTRATRCPTHLPAPLCS